MPVGRVTNCFVSALIARSIEAKCLAAIICVGVLACADRRESDHTRGTTPLGKQIAAQLGSQLGMALDVACATVPPACLVILPDRSELPIRLVRDRDAWSWQIDGLLVVSDPIERYLRDTLADLQVAQSVTCAPRVRVLRDNERVQCMLERGGRAFVTVRRDGTFGVELVLDATAALARSDEEPGHDRELDEQSRALVDGGTAPGDPDDVDDDGE